MRLLTLAFTLALVSPVFAANLKIDDFEGATASVGGNWWSSADDKSGSTIAPLPFVSEKGGASGKFCGRIHGRLSANKEPWPWAGMALKLAGDLRGYKAIEFWAKGDGKSHNVRLEKKSVTDSAHYSASFVAPAKWAKVTIALKDFKQPTWAKQVPQTFEDVEKLSFYPVSYESTYDFSVDNISLIK